MPEIIDWQRAAQVCQETPEVVAAWACGSARDGTVRPGGDTDMAVQLESLPYLSRQIELPAKLQMALQLEEIDLMVLNDAKPILGFEASSDRRLFCRDAGRRATSASLTAREVEDEMALWQRALRDWHTLHGRFKIEA